MRPCELEKKVGEELLKLALGSDYDRTTSQINRTDDFVIQKTHLERKLEDVRNTSESIVRDLFNNGAQVHPSNRPLGDPLHIALYVGPVPIAKLLLEHGAYINSRGGFSVRRCSQLWFLEGTQFSSFFWPKESMLICARNVLCQLYAMLGRYEVPGH